MIHHHQKVLYGNLQQLYIDGLVSLIVLIGNYLWLY